MQSDAAGCPRGTRAEHDELQGDRLSRGSDVGRGVSCALCMENTVTVHGKYSGGGASTYPLRAQLQLIMGAQSAWEPLIGDPVGLAAVVLGYPRADYDPGPGEP